MKKLKWKGIAAIALASMLVLSGCGGGTQAPAEGGGERADLTSQSVDIVKATDTSRNPQAALDRKDTIVIGTDDFNGVFIPQLGQTVPDRQIYELLFEPLVGVDEEGKPIDDAIATWTVEDDVKYIFTIKDGVVFSDGTPVTAEDVEFSYLVIADPTYDASSDIGKYGILGVDAYKNGQADSIEGIKVIDEKTIEFTLEKPNAEVIYFFTLGIIPKAYYGEGYTFGDLSSIRDL